MIMSTNFARCWDIDRGTSVADVSSWCIERRGVNRLMVAIRPYIDRKNRVGFDPLVQESTVEIFGDRILRKVFARGWPGTRLIDHRGEVYVVAFDVTVQRRMVQASNEFSGWTQWSTPPLPEDICLYRDGEDSPVLVSVTHDGDSWLFDNQPDATFVRRATIELPSELIPSAPEFILEPTLEMPPVWE